MGLAHVQEPLLNNAANVVVVEWLTTTKVFLHFQVHANGAMVGETSSRHQVLGAAARVWKCVRAK